MVSPNGQPGVIAQQAVVAETWNAHEAAQIPLLRMVDKPVSNKNWDQLLKQQNAENPLVPVSSTEYLKLNHNQSIVILIIWKR